MSHPCQYVSVFPRTVLLLTAMVLLAVMLVAQAAPTRTQSASITVRLDLDKSRVTVGKSPWAILTVNNLADRVLALPAVATRLHVETQNAEAPSTIAQRTITGKLRPGDSPLRMDERDIWTIQPEEFSFHKYLISYFYDISKPGKYSVYIEVLDQGEWVRTSTATFEIQAPKPL